MTMSILILFILLLQTSYYSCKNSCRMSNLDNKMKSLTKMLGDSNAKWPENEEQKHKFCSLMFEAAAHAKFFKRACYRGITHSLIKFIIVANEYTNIKISCKSAEEMNRFLDRGKCGNRAKKETAKCWTNWIDKLNMIKNVSQTDKKVPLLCCSLSEWKKCSHDVYRSLGSKVCSQTSIDGFDNYMKRSIEDPLNVIFQCNDHDKKQCTQMSKSLSKINKQKSRYKTPFPAILDISHSL